MYVKQISVFIENTPGRLAHFTKLLGDNNIDLVSLSVADTTHFGILRGIVADYEKAVKLISDNGYTVKLTDVLAVSVPDHPGGLAEVLEALSGHDIVVEYLYSFVRNAGDHALIIFRVDKLDEAEKVLLTQLDQVGRQRVRAVPMALDELVPPVRQVKAIRDTVATLRLDAVASSGFSLARSKMADAISSGKVALNGRECVKPDRTVAEGDVITCRGLGKCVLKEVSGPFKKGRTMIVIERYV